MANSGKRNPVDTNELEYGKVYECEIEHWSESIMKTHEVRLKYVDEDDCCWRFLDGSELSYDWSVIKADGKYSKFK